MWPPLGRLSYRAKLIFDVVNWKFNKKNLGCGGGGTGQEPFCAIRILVEGVKCFIFLE